MGVRGSILSAARPPEALPSEDQEQQGAGAWVCTEGFRKRAIKSGAAWKDTLQPENKTGYVVQTDPLPASVFKAKTLESEMGSWNQAQPPDLMVNAKADWH